MKRILLASASIVAFAGAAAAQDDLPTGIIFGGDASLGFNDNFNDEEETGFFYEANLAVTFRTVLDNGLVAESTFTIPVADTNLGTDLGVDDDFVLGLSLDGVGGLFLGDVLFAGEEFTFSSMQSADFSEQDGETVLRGEGTLAGFTVAGSALILDEDGDEPGERDFGTEDNEQDFVDQISVSGDGNIGNLALSFAYQDESDIIGGEDDETTVEIDEGDSVEDRFDTTNDDFNSDSQFGLAAGLAFRGADVLLGYGRNLSGIDANGDGEETETQSYGIQVSYPFGPVTGTVEYVIEDEDEYDTAYSYNFAVAYETDRAIFEAEYGEEVGEEEYDIKIGYAFTDVTSLQAGYNDDDKGFAAIRQGFGAGAFVEMSYAEVEDAGFGNEDFVDDIREGTTLKVGLEF